MNDGMLRLIALGFTALGTIFGIGGAWMNLNVRLGVVEVNQQNTQQLLQEIKDDSKEIRSDIKELTKRSRN